MRRLSGSLSVAILLAGAIAGAGWFVSASLREAGTQATAAEPTAPAAKPGDTTKPADPALTPDGKIVRSEAEWKKLLTDKEYYVMRQKGTERAFTGKYTNTKTPGLYKCAGCGEVLFSSDGKFDSHCGWPSFFQPAEGLKSKKIDEHVDTTAGMIRTEVTCAKCGAHLGHVFNDGVGTPTGLRYCINSVSIKLEPKKPEAKPTGTAAATPEKK